MCVHSGKQSPGIGLILVLEAGCILGFFFWGGGNSYYIFWYFILAFLFKNAKLRIKKKKK